jgi:glycosyltransferase involved in cell wall biosynthesis
VRILYSHRIQSRDGQSVHIEELVGALRAAGHEVLVVGPGFYQASSFGGESSAVARLRRLLPGAAGEAAELAYNLPAYRRLRRACREFRPDLIYERYNLFYLAGHWLAGQTGLPYFLEVNSPLAQERTQHGTLRLQRLAHLLERRVWRSATRVLPVTQALADIIAAAGVARNRLHIVPNGVVLDRFPVAPPRGAGTVTLGFVGFVRDWHGMDALIRHMAADPAPLALTVVGDGPARPGLESLAAELGLAARVRFTGVVEHAEVPAAVAAFDIALQPKVVAYASPLKIFDYMAAGRAIVAPDQPNIREILYHGRTALLFNPADPGALWAAVQRLAADPALRARLGTAARAELVSQDHTWAGNARRIAGWAMEDAASPSSSGRGPG